MLSVAEACEGELPESAGAVAPGVDGVRGQVGREAAAGGDGQRTPALEVCIARGLELGHGDATMLCGPLGSFPSRVCAGELVQPDSQLDKSLSTCRSLGSVTDRDPSTLGRGL